MWIAGVGPGRSSRRSSRRRVALLISGYFAARQQHAYSPILAERPRAHPGGLGAGGHRLAHPGLRHRRQRRHEHPVSDRGRQFSLPSASRSEPPYCSPWVCAGPAGGSSGNRQGYRLPTFPGALRLHDAGRGTAAGFAFSALGLGFVSAVFDNIPDRPGPSNRGYDWGFLAYVVGSGGSMICSAPPPGWRFPTCTPRPESVASSLRHGWHVALAYVVGLASWPR